MIGHVVASVATWTVLGGQWVAVPTNYFNPTTELRGELCNFHGKVLWLATRLVSALVQWWLMKYYEHARPGGQGSSMPNKTSKAKVHVVIAMPCNARQHKWPCAWRRISENWLHTTMMARRHFAACAQLALVPPRVLLPWGTVMAPLTQCTGQQTCTGSNYATGTSVI